jgi:GNAT superfamily N-acetyltransferase
MQAIYAEATSYVGADPSVVDLGSALRRLPAGATRPNITRLGTEHEAQLSALLCGLDKAARINRFGHLASNACVRPMPRTLRPGPPTWPGRSTRTASSAWSRCLRPRDGVAEVAFAVDADWHRRGIGSALLEAATRWAEQAGVTTLRMVISRNSWPMRQFAHKAGARLEFDLDEIFADIAVATAASLDIAA